MRPAYIVVATLLYSIHCNDAYNILLLPRNDLDILYQFRGLAELLIKRGHSVTVVANSQDPQINSLFNDTAASLIYHSYATIPTKDNTDYLYSDEKYEATYVEKHVKKVLTEECMKVVYSDGLYERIRIRKFHLAVVDSSVFCYNIVPYKLAIPFVSLGTSVYPYLMRMHPLLSVEPCSMKGDSFLSRIYRLVSGIYGEIQPKLLIDESQFSHAVPEKPFYSLREIAANSTLWFVIRDPVLDCPLPVSPGVIQLSNLTPNLNRSLSGNTRKFLESNSKSVIVIWFSNSLRNLTSPIVKKISASSQKLKQLLYIWHRENTTLAADNVITVDNVSLDYLLALPRVKVLITDCNTYATSEAIRASVPVLCMPILGEHRYNTYRLVTKNMGLHLDIRKFRAQDLTKRIRNLVKKEKYRVTMKRFSMMQREFPSSINQAALWMEHVIKFGAEHLKTSANDQSLVHYLMLDLCAAAFAVSIMLAYSLKYTIKIAINTRLARKVYKKCSSVINVFNRSSDKAEKWSDSQERREDADGEAEDEYNEQIVEKLEKSERMNETAQRHCGHSDHHSHHGKHSKIE